MSANEPIVAIVGRPNVGKSTFFNRLAQKRKSIIHHQAGITRDRVYEIINWTGRQFMLVDTGGFVPDSEDVMDTAIREQVHIAVDEADLILFLVDAQQELTSMDKEIASVLRSSGKEVLLIANKCDNEKQELNQFNLYELGFGETYPISALSGRRIGDLLDLILAKLPKTVAEKEDDRHLQLAIVGMPNAGKSSLVNALIGQDKNIVTDIPGTTRDSIDTKLKHFGETITLIDTAGIRRQKRVSSSVEFYSAVRSERAIERCHIAVVVIDGYKGITRQDQNILRKVINLNKGLIVAINKWDLVTKDNHTLNMYKRALIYEFAPLEYYPILFISAKTKQRTFKVIEKAREVYDSRAKRLTTRELNDYFLPLIDRNPPPAVKGNYIKIKYITQVKSAPPVIVFFCNFPKDVTEDYKRYLERQFRQKFGFEGVPVLLKFREK